jgi:hypothetical protein
MAGKKGGTDIMSIVAPKSGAMKPSAPKMGKKSDKREMRKDTRR